MPVAPASSPAARVLPPPAQASRPAPTHTSKPAPAQGLPAATPKTLRDVAGFATGTGNKIALSTAAPSSPVPTPAPTALNPSATDRPVPGPPRGGSGQPDKPFPEAARDWLKARGEWLGNAATKVFGELPTAGKVAEFGGRILGIAGGALEGLGTGLKGSQEVAAQGPQASTNPSAKSTQPAAPDIRSLAKQAAMGPHTITATLGANTGATLTTQYPLSGEANMIRSGANEFRIDAAKLGSPDGLKAELERVQKAKAAVPNGKDVKTVLDLAGPEQSMRLGLISHWSKDGKPIHSLDLKQGDQWVIDTQQQNAGGPRGGALPSVGFFSNSRPDIVNSVQLGDTLALGANGAQKVQVTGKNDRAITVRMLQDGKVESAARLSPVGGRLTNETLTPTDFRYLDKAAEMMKSNHPIDVIGVSAVRGPESLQAVRKYMETRGLRPLIQSNIDTPDAVRNIGPIVNASDRVAVMRDRLGIVQGPGQSVAQTQADVLRLALPAHKPVSIDGNMPSMMKMENPTPTATEVDGVNRAVKDGISGFTLKGETSYGLHPLETIGTMRDTIRQAENEAGAR